MFVVLYFKLIMLHWLFTCNIKDSYSLLMDANSLWFYGWGGWMDQNNTGLFHRKPEFESSVKQLLLLW